MKRNKRWTRYSHDALLDVRICDLGLKLKASRLNRLVKRLYSDLEAKGIQFRPHCWLSLEWFSPFGEPGFSIPFYLAHPRLMKLEEKMMCEVEGGTTEWCMRILRHEAGHAIETAYRLTDRAGFRKFFGNPKKPYPESYKPNPQSNRFVRHLGFWYAQAHPFEDFAETFSVWLRPGSRWQTVYRDWPALKKLQFVDRLMRDIGRRTPLIRSRRHEEPLSSIKKTLHQFYCEKKKHYEVNRLDDYDEDLTHLFPRGNLRKKTMAAANYMTRNRKEIISAVAHASKTDLYLAEQVLHEMILRARYLHLFLQLGQSGLKLQIAALVTVHVRRIWEKGFPRIIV